MARFGGRLTRAWALTAGAGVLATGTAMVVAPQGAAFGLTSDASETSHESRLRRDANEVVETGATGMVVEVEGADGERARARAGVAELGTDEPVPWGSYYRIGSDTKTFVSVVALQLVDEGRISLSDTVEDWLPGVVTGEGNDGSRITVENLLRQTSGLANYTDIIFGEPGALTPEHYLENRFVSMSPEEAVAVAMTEPPGWLPDADDPAGETRWEYSNTNYVLAGMIIEEATGHRWEQEVHDRIIEPLGLEHTISPGNSPYIPRPTAHAYLQFPGYEELTDTTLTADAGADGAMISTPADRNTFLRALMDGTLLSEERLADMRRTVPASAFGPGAEYGLGLVWAPRCGEGEPGLWFHGGTSFGTISEGAVTEDGSAAASAAVFTVRFDDAEGQEAQDEATLELIDNALCGAGR
ncbi:serine hydrolase domain-containing protein [Streptomyces triticirhizae]|uniref:Class A beta-lactamase-related serine hydrolase n=1 Tax=Streptomyces triticirhizae TaxID=2483353 RepID=A0A3M2LY84_9ACTN|nr:serine hydrolase domain-containing protein [Streptomyces triticirhizae]RMI42401.1 class A beta-lactamase-related serine hydrolase [Streptomyces triticirhizae]